MKTVICTIIAVVLAFSFPFECPAGHAWSSAPQPQGIAAMMEISWVLGNIRYTGLMVLRNDVKTGVFVVKYLLPGRGIVRVRQKAQLDTQNTPFGYTSIITCSNPTSNPEGIPYSPDRFLINPNGTMATMDAQGNWSLMITAAPISPNYWMDKLIQYGLKNDLTDENDDEYDIRRATPKYAMNEMRFCLKA